MKNKKNTKDFILSETFRLLRQHYPVGMYEYLHLYHFSVYAKMREIENEIIDNFDSRSINDLKDILACYWRLHIESAKKYKSEGQLNFNVSEIKKQINDELHVT